MAKTDNLTDFLVDLADAIRTKKGTTEPINPQDFSAEIESIESSGGEFSWDFSRIGYTSENTTLLQQFEDAIAYSEEKARTFIKSNVNTHFRGDGKLVFAPMVDISGVVSLENTFNQCYALATIPMLDTSSVNRLYQTFTKCYSLASIPPLDTSNVTSMSYTFQYCTSLTVIPPLDTSNVTSMSSTFASCYALTTIPQIDMGKVTSMNYMFQSCSKLVFALIKNIGKSTLKTYDFSGATAWGTGGEENRQSLIDSLITYSYDRASNGMDTATITLSANTKALLTEEEIAQITAKDYTIA